jgi:hypothetical protein
LDMWTNPTIWQALTPLADGTGNEHRNYFPTFCTLPFTTLVILTSCDSKLSHTIQTDISDRPNTSGRKGASNSGHKARKTSPHLPAT